MNKKIFSYVCVVFIGTGFIGMGADNVAKSETFSSIQIILELTFMIIALYKIIIEKKKLKL